MNEQYIYTNSTSRRGRIRESERKERWKRRWREKKDETQRDIKL